MNKKVAVFVVALTVPLVLAGCIGSDGTASDTPQPEAGAGETPATTPTGDSGSGQASELDEHPAVSDGTLNVSQLVRGHIDALSQSDSFTILNNRTATYANNGTSQGRSVMTNRVDLANQRQYVERRSVDGDGQVRAVEARYGNATTTCLNSGEGFQCQETGVETREMLGLAIETTSLETVAAPAFSPDGTVERNGQSLYRYSASSFHSPLESNTESELYGEDPSLVTATLLVHPDGRIVSYTLTYRTGGETPQTLELVYRTDGIDDTTVSPPEELE
jgi:hypothetical protein